MWSRCSFRPLTMRFVFSFRWAKGSNKPVSMTHSTRGQPSKISTFTSVCESNDIFSTSHKKRIVFLYLFVRCRQNRDCSLKWGTMNPAPPITVSFLIDVLHPHIFAAPTSIQCVISYWSSPATHISLLLIPRFNLHSILPLDSNREAALTFFFILRFLLLGNRLPGFFTIQINRNGHTVCHKYFLCLPRPFSLALVSSLYQASLLILIIPIPGFSFHNNSPKWTMQFSYLLLIYWLAFQSALFPLYFSTHDSKPCKISKMGSLPLLNISTVVLPPICNP